VIKAEFIIITPVSHDPLKHDSTWNMYDYYQSWKQLCCFRSLWKLSYIFFWFFDQ